MKAELIHGAQVFETIKDEWDELATDGMTDTPFQRLAYQEAWWRHLHPEDATLHTIIMRNEAGALGGIACLYNVNGLVHFNGCVEETDYLDLICRAEDAETAWTAVWRAITGPNFPGWHTVELCNVPQDSPTREIVPALAEEHGLGFAESVHEVCPVVRLPGSFDDYLDMLESKQRREIRRKLRRAKGLGVELVEIGPDDDLETAVDDFLDLLQKSTAEKREWLNEGRRAVFHATAAAAQREGYLQLLFTEVNGEKASALFNFDYDDHILVYNSGLDPAAFGRLSLGEVLTARAIELAIANGRETFDFLRGDEAYKYRFGAEDTMVYKLQVKVNGDD